MSLPAFLFGGMMGLSRSELETWRDQIIEEMKRITKAPGTVGGGVSTDNQKRMAILSEQLLAVNRLLALEGGPSAIKIDGIDK